MKMNELLEERFSAPAHTKVKALAKQSNEGNLTSFAGIFQAAELPESEREALQNLLHSFSDDSKDTRNDFQELVQITSEVRAINNQAAILHGERILRAQKLLKSYKEGAFTAWLIAAYGNRQTPYNFLLYYEFLQQLPVNLKKTAEAMPRQAVYVLASRNVPLEQKKEVVASYKGETKREMLEYIRESFPLPENDKRRSLIGERIVQLLKQSLQLLEKHPDEVREEERKVIAKLLQKVKLELCKPGK